MASIAVLLQPYDTEPAPPERWPFARAALGLDVEVVFGGHAEDGCFVGQQVVSGGWNPWRGVPDVVLDRFPSQTHPVRHAAVLEQLIGVLVFNPPPLTALFRDKLRTQAVLQDLGMPAVRADPRRFGEVLPGFCKPRFGSFGRGVFHTNTVPSAHGKQVHLVQRAVPPPRGYAGVALRILVQRTCTGIEVFPPVARFHQEQRVVNRARGASVRVCEAVFPKAVQPAMALAEQVFARFPGAIELGIDAVLDPNHQPHLIEVNSRPRGRLAALAAQEPARFGALHERACRQPLEVALQRA